MHKLLYLSAAIPLVLACAAKAQVFYRADELPASLQPRSAAYRNFVDATFSFTIEGARCTGAFISPNGVFITAAHCLGKNDDASWALQMTERVVDGTDWVDVGNFAPRPGSVRIDADLHGVAGVGDPKVTLTPLLTGRVYNELSAPLGPFLDEAPYLSQEGDFAVVAIEEFQSWNDLPYLSFSGATDLAKGTRIWAAGYPDAAIAPGGESTDGVSLYVTHGETVWAFGAQGTPAEQAQANWDASGPGHFPAHIMAWFGMSGGPVVNGDGSLVGIIHGTNSTSEGRAGVTEITSASAITQAVRRWLRGTLTIKVTPEAAPGTEDLACGEPGWVSGASHPCP